MNDWIQPGAMAQHYRFERELGEIQRFLWWQCTNLNTGSLYWAFVLPPIYLDSDEVRTSVMDELRIWSTFSHPSYLMIETILETFEDKPAVMFFVQAPDNVIPFREARGKLQESQIAHIFQQLANLVGQAHLHAIDGEFVKPKVELSSDSIFVSATHQPPYVWYIPIPTQSFSRASQTQAGILKGSLQYLSPEMAAGRSRGDASDYFVLGSLLVEAATGQQAFAGSSDFESLQRIVTGEASGLRSEQLSPSLQALASDLLQVDTNQRLTDAASLQARLGDLASPSREQSLATGAQQSFSPPADDSFDDDASILSPTRGGGGSPPPLGGETLDGTPSGSFGAAPHAPPMFGNAPPAPTRPLSPAAPPAPPMPQASAPPAPPRPSAASPAPKNFSAPPSSPPMASMPPPAPGPAPMPPGGAPPPAPQSPAYYGAPNLGVRTDEVTRTEDTPALSSSVIGGSLDSWQDEGELDGGVTEEVPAMPQASPSAPLSSMPPAPAKAKKRAASFGSSSARSLEPDIQAIQAEQQAVEEARASVMAGDLEPIQEDTAENLVKVLRRKGVVRNYTQMNPGKVFPLLVSIVEADLYIKIPDLPNVQQVESDKVLTIKETSPFVRIVPVMPGCLISPPEAVVDVRKEKVDIEFWVAPQAEGDLTRSARVQVWHEGLLKDEIPIPCKVVTQTLTKIASYSSVFSSLLGAVFETYGHKLSPDPKVLDTDQAGLLSFLLQKTVGLLSSSGIWLGLFFLLTAFGCYLWLRPKRGDVIERFLTTDLH